MTVFSLLEGRKGWKLGVSLLEWFWIVGLRVFLVAGRVGGLDGLGKVGMAATVGRLARHDSGIYESFELWSKITWKENVIVTGTGQANSLHSLSDPFRIQRETRQRQQTMDVDHTQGMLDTCLLEFLSFEPRWGNEGGMRGRTSINREFLGPGFRFDGWDLSLTCSCRHPTLLFR